MARSGRLDQVPAVAERVAPDGDGAVRFVAWGFFELNPFGQHAGVVAGEIAGFKEQPDPPAGLIADGGGLWRRPGVRR